MEPYNEEQTPYLRFLLKDDDHQQVRYTPSNPDYAADCEKAAVAYLESLQPISLARDEKRGFTSSSFKSIILSDENKGKLSIFQELFKEVAAAHQVASISPEIFKLQAESYLKEVAKAHSLEYCVGKEFSR